MDSRHRPARNERPRQRIMLLDDEKDITEPIKMQLEGEGYVVSAFNDPILAVKTYAPGACDLAIIDIAMPGMNGFQVCRELLSRDAKLKICFFTAFEIYSNEFAKVFPDMKSVHLITKPVTGSKLMRAIEEMLVEEGSIRAT
jgi:CheY-like chemotaxis protein